MKVSQRTKVTPSMYRHIKAAALQAKRNGTWDAGVVSKEHRVSVSTVRAIVASGSWPKYQAKNAAYNVARRERRDEARAAEINAQEPSKIAIDTAEDAAKQLDEALASLNQRATKQDLLREVEIIHDRLDVQYGALKLIMGSWIGRLVLGGSRAQARAISRLVMDHHIAQKRSLHRREGQR